MSNEIDNPSSPKPSYYAIIPANVRYSKNLEPNAKLLYGEITALSGAEGYCWASNQYFANLYDVSVRTIQRWISSLAANNFVRIEAVDQNANSLRKIYIVSESQPIQNGSQRHDKNVRGATKMSPK